ncbi:MAG: hypothetical protein IPI59_01310 [Sphingobacteriales bacterium]|jgi:Tfp pilus assembly protein PilX|nr:hypothetical protein [Sphingobacteriales bacterium]MBP9141354.1 hypothetical protein [Chitinophagales bacterium]MDA0198030.1 hypothetical protein [Bacteroidota bacterium]MBK6890741.1 hypothetical protein [Sphingobacteriales bacterium]MBK7526207.1 hypothetical protein [Sphingobacteriales bacterium]
MKKLIALLVIALLGISVSQNTFAQNSMTRDTPKKEERKNSDKNDKKNTEEKVIRKGKVKSVEGTQAMTVEERAQDYANYLNQKIGLTPDQVQQIQSINIDCENKLDNAKANVITAKSTQKEFSKSSRAALDARENAIKAILNKEQIKKYDQMIKELRAMRN